jgi:molybdate transport system regulatory protein
MDMSYKRAWQLIDAMNRDFGAVVATSTGGAGGGGAALTTKGAALVAAYDALERRVNRAADAQIAALAALLPSRRTR